MTTLTEKYTDQSGRIYYQPILTKITGTSRFKDSEHSLDGIQGFWEQGRISVPPQGVLAWFTLATKPKTGPNSKPGALYHDIIDVTRASDADKANYQPPTRTPDTGRYNAPLGTGQRAQGDPRDEQPAQSTSSVEERILLGMAFNNLTTVLTIKDVGKYFPDGADGWELWHRWFNEASRGLPLTPVVDESAAIEQEAEQLDQQAAAAINGPEIVDGQEVQSLPW